MSNLDLENVIEDAVNDSVVPDTPTEVETSPDTSTETTETTIESTSSEVTSPATAVEEPKPDTEVDEFDKRHGLQAQSAFPGRENRIPYSRVRKIVEKAEKDAVLRAKKETEGGFQPKLTEYESKVKDYEGRLERVAQFEHMIENDPQTFLGILAKIPAYKGFFDHINQLQSGNVQQPQTQTADPASTMPQPDQVLGDGTKVYSMDGLKALLDWQAKNVEDRVEKRVQEKYAPMEQEWQAQQRMAKAMPLIQKQIAEARQWPQFTENEQAIIEVLRANPNITLDGAYRQVVVPKLVSSRDDHRKSILEEIRKSPMTTAAPVVTSKSPNPANSGGKRNIEDIINEQIAKIR